MSGFVLFFRTCIIPSACDMTSQAASNVPTAPSRVNESIAELGSGVSHALQEIKGRLATRDEVLRNLVQLCKSANQILVRSEANCKHDQRVVRSLAVLGRRRHGQASSSPSNPDSLGAVAYAEADTDLSWKHLMSTSCHRGWFDNESYHHGGLSDLAGSKRKRCRDDNTCPDDESGARVGQRVGQLLLELDEWTSEVRMGSKAEQESARKAVPPKKRDAAKTQLNGGRRQSRVNNKDVPPLGARLPSARPFESQGNPSDGTSQPLGLLGCIDHELGMLIGQWLSGSDIGRLRPRLESITGEVTSSTVSPTAPGLGSLSIMPLYGADTMEMMRAALCILLRQGASSVLADDDQHAHPDDPSTTDDMIFAPTLTTGGDAAIRMWGESFASMLSRWKHRVERQGVVRGRIVGWVALDRPSAEDRAGLTSWIVYSLYLEDRAAVFYTLNEWQDEKVESIASDMIEAVFPDEAQAWFSQRVRMELRDPAFVNQYMGPLAVHLMSATVQGGSSGNLLSSDSVRRALPINPNILILDQLQVVVDLYRRARIFRTDVQAGNVVYLPRAIDDDFLDELDGMNEEAMRSSAPTAISYTLLRI